MSDKTFLVMAGGTGGHVYPALASALALREQGAKVVWLGARGGMEERIISRTDIPMRLITIGGLRGKGAAALLMAPVNLMRALWQAFSVFRKEKPDCVLGMGGFASGPGGIVACLTGTPLVIHEQNAIAGMTNRWLARGARYVLEAFPQTFAQAQSVVTVGNPVRDELAALPSPQERGIGSRKPTLLILGGSRGALALNEAAPKAIAALPEALRPRIVHQAGEGKDQACRELYASLGVEAEVHDFLQDMASVYANADLALCRAGALTLAELCTVGLGALLAPYPHAVDDHQTANARHLEQAGAAKIFQQDHLTVERLAETLTSLLGQPQKLLEMANAARTLAKPEATREVVKYCWEACAND
ncbi:undecaprenyldiphospho-muramoylpentapeptide beta-N-acetylglucosaminyltransferase [Hahella sp. HN01]|uniref:undecaprenyldiphospho-muramoylpentapeptide beta-N-acetylglucosaminyltransferase n=1 Tax=Hahella sp. HN01 TaxID=2847262 RepID=UPI001C1EEFB4|nr:undecaprenyldiphospho-muramoylpentapeptide beta-N-acetylglucosaminyltransferase [Hahella sp. HN01]MBU6951810.1 undecaprenyldiphospho-muramoylpentapeptide beta-N-acetylglucosaminyltransferase [Hahella sp. HN01]